MGDAGFSFGSPIPAIFPKSPSPRPAPQSLTTPSAPAPPASASTAIAANTWPRMPWRASRSRTPIPFPPHAWSFFVNEYGKPSPIPDCGLRFNQSNSVELAVCLVASPGTLGPHVSSAASAATGIEVGVDVEPFSRAEEIVPLAPQVFSLAERAQLDALPVTDRPDRALSLWTLKEAYIKARGMGLSLPLAKFRSSSAVLKASGFELQRASTTIPRAGDFACSITSSTASRS